MHGAAFHSAAEQLTFSEPAPPISPAASLERSGRRLHTKCARQVKTGWQEVAQQLAAHATGEPRRVLRWRPWRPGHGAELSATLHPCMHACACRVHVCRGGCLLCTHAAWAQPAVQRALRGQAPAAPAVAGQRRAHALAAVELVCEGGEGIVVTLHAARHACHTTPRRQASSQPRRTNRAVLGCGYVA